MPIFVAPFLGRHFAAAPELGLASRLRLVRRFRSNRRRIETASHWLEHLHMARALLDVPQGIEGVVVECGCYKGGSSANLSLACEVAGRRLVIHDSFAGLPEPKRYDRVHEAPFAERVTRYAQGQYHGSYAEVEANIRRYGCIDCCELVEGLFDQTLPGRDEPVVLAFLDVDLHDSLEVCLREIWPRLREGCRLYSHEAKDLRLVARFFDEPWWRENLGTSAPGFIGAGTGLPLGGPGRGSSLGYAEKGPSILHRVPSR